MIELEVLSSPDREMIGKHVYFKNVLGLGRSFGDLLVNDSGIIDGHLRIEFTPSGAYCYKNEKIDHYLLNGKRTTGKRELSVNDRIGLGSTTIHVASLAFMEHEKKKAIINRNLNLLLNDSALADAKDIFDRLEQDLAQIS